MATIQITMVGRTGSSNSNQSAVILLGMMLCYSHDREFYTSDQIRENDLRPERTRERWCEKTRSWMSLLSDL